jgi:DNA-binding NtrC family response regulator
MKGTLMTTTEGSRTRQQAAQKDDEICIIESDSDIGELLVDLLENQFLIRSFSSIAEFEKNFMNSTSNLKTDLILCDTRAQDPASLEALRNVRKKDAIVPVILIVNQPDSDWTKQAFQAGVTDLLEKPFESFLFIDKFRGRIAQARAQRERQSAIELLETQLHLLTTHCNRLSDEINQLSHRTARKKLPYASPDPESIQFTHARKNEEKLLKELAKCRTEYLKLASTPRIF